MHIFSNKSTITEYVDLKKNQENKINSQTHSQIHVFTVTRKTHSLRLFFSLSSSHVAMHVLSTNQMFIYIGNICKLDDNKPINDVDKLDFSFNNTNDVISNNLNECEKFRLFTSFSFNANAYSDIQRILIYI